MATPGLAEMRAEALVYMTDTCTRYLRQSIAAHGGAATGGDGRGGVSNTAGGATDGFIEGDTTVCRIEMFRPRSAIGEEMRGGAIIEKDEAILAVPHDFWVENEDEMEVVSEGRTTRWTVLQGFFNSENITQKISLQRVGNA